MNGTCFYHGATDAELRPYGPGGAPICFPCMKADSERERAAGAVFGAVLGAAEAMSPVGVAVVGRESGPQPYVPGDQQH